MDDIAIIRTNDASTVSLESNQEKNGIFYSELHGIYSNKIFRNFSIKCVISGQEMYKLNGSEYKLEAGMLLLASKDPEGEVYFDNKTPAIGLCIDIKESTLAEAVYAINASPDLDFELTLDKYKHPYFFERTDRIDNTLLFEQINSVTSSVLLNKETVFQPGDEWFLSLAEKIVLQEMAFSKSLHRIHTVKLSTKKEVFKRLLVGKAYMDEYYLTKPPIHQIAVAASLSEFHFFRSFRQAFDITPYQYMLDKRLNYANHLIKQEGLPFSVIAKICAFPDYFTFSKAYRRKFRITPTEYKALLLRLPS